MEEQIDKEETVAAWEGFRDKPFLVQAARIESVVAVGEQLSEEVETLISHGVRPEFGAIEVTLSAADQQTIAAALNVVGFFSEYLANKADELLTRLVDLQEVSPEDELAIGEACKTIAKEEMANLFGMSLEKYEQLQQEEQARRRADEGDPED